MSEDFERDPLDTDKGFDPLRISASRVNKLAECGVAFQMKYLEGVPEQVRGSFALFGSVVHEALEKWSVNREQDLLELMRQAWQSQTHGTIVQKFLAEYAKINVGVLKAEKKAIDAFNNRPENRRLGKTCQAPRMTKAFKESPEAQALQKLMREWMPKLDRESPWKFTERDPLPQFYDDSLVIAKRYGRQWGYLRPALHTEFSFDIEWHGFNLNGYIDVIEALMSPDGELLGIGVLDYKTYRREPSEHKDYRQLVMYDVALRHMLETGMLQLPIAVTEDTPIYVGIDYVRQAGVETDWKMLVREGDDHSHGNSRGWWQIGPADHDRLLRELQAYHGTVSNGYFLPADKGQNADFCDYGSLCCMRSTEAAGGCATRVELAV